MQTNLQILNCASKLNSDCIIIFLMTRFSKQDHTYLCLHDILKIIFLILINEFRLLEINILTIRTNNYSYEQKIKCHKQIIM